MNQLCNALTLHHKDKFTYYYSHHHFVLKLLEFLVWVIRAKMWYAVLNEKKKKKKSWAEQPIHLYVHKADAKKSCNRNSR